MAKKEDLKKNKDDRKTEKDNKTSMEANKTTSNNDTSEDIEKNEECYENLKKENEELKQEITCLKEKVASYEAKEKEDAVNSVLYAIENSGVTDKNVLENIKKEAERFTLDNISDFYYIAKGMAFSYIQEHGLNIQKEDDGITRFAGKEKLDLSKDIDKKDPNIYG